jgi:hypothetical protein
MKKRTLFIICIAILLFDLHATREVQATSEAALQALDEANSYIPVGLLMIDSAVEVLSRGLSNLSPDEKEQLERIFDPSGSGTIDQEYLNAVLDNFHKIQRQFEKPSSLKYEESSSMCQRMRLYYTYFFKIYVCPYFTIENDGERKARDLVHEIAHIALMSGDRPYYNVKTYSASYNRLTPRGSWATQVPVIGPIFREILRGDTLYHPDAYAWFAAIMYSRQR